MNLQFETMGTNSFEFIFGVACYTLGLLVELSRCAAGEFEWFGGVMGLVIGSVLLLVSIIAGESVLYLL